MCYERRDPNAARSCWERDQRGKKVAEYIEREALMKHFCERCNEDFESEPCEPTDCFALQIIKSVPAADVAPVVHGRWVYDFTLGGSNFYRCSVCNRQEVLLEKEDIVEWCPYCHCGARMDGE